MDGPLPALQDTAGDALRAVATYDDAGVEIVFERDDVAGKEAVVGDLRDEFDTDESEPSIRQQDEGVYEIDGGVPLSVVNDTLDADFESEGFETLGGLILERLDRTPKLDDTIEEAGYTLTVTGVDGARIVVVRVEQRE